MRFYLFFYLFIGGIQIVFSQNSDSRQEIIKEYYGNDSNRLKKIFYLYEGKFHPKVMYYSRNGKLRAVLYFNHGKFQLSKTYKTNGGKSENKVIKVHGLRLSKVKSKYMFDLNILKDSLMYNIYNSSGKKEGLWIEHQILTLFSSSFEDYYCVGNYNDDKKNGVWRYYLFDSGQLDYSLEYKNDTINGKVLVYDLEGNLMGDISYENGRKQGVSLFYYKNGNLGCKTEYNFGKTVKSEYYKKNGTPLKNH